MSLVLFRSLLTIHLEHVLQHVLCVVDSILIIFNTSNREDSYAHFTGRKLGLEATELNDLPQVTQQLLQQPQGEPLCLRQPCLSHGISSRALFCQVGMWSYPEFGPLPRPKARGTAVMGSPGLQTLVGLNSETPEETPCPPVPCPWASQAQVLRPKTVLYPVGW